MNLKMVHKLFLSLSFLLLLLQGLSAFAVPSTRSLKSTEEKPSSVLEFLTQDEMELNVGEKEVVDLEEGYMNGRMDLENTDYPGTGANNHHDPKSPGRP